MHAPAIKAINMQTWPEKMCQTLWTGLRILLLFLIGFRELGVCIVAATVVRYLVLNV